jgi:hypothetical protein
VRLDQQPHKLSPPALSIALLFSLHTLPQQP